MLYPVSLHIVIQNNPESCFSPPFRSHIEDPKNMLIRNFKVYVALFSGNLIYSIQRFFYWFTEFLVPQIETETGDKREVQDGAQAFSFRSHGRLDLCFSHRLS